MGSGPPQKKSLVIFFNLGAFKGYLLVPPVWIAYIGYPNEAIQTGGTRRYPLKSPKIKKCYKAFLLRGSQGYQIYKQKSKLKKKKFGFGDGGEYSLHEMSS